MKSESHVKEHFERLKAAINESLEKRQCELLEQVIFTARKRSLGQGNIFAPVCHSVHKGEYLGRYPARPGFPLRLENLENLEKWEGIFQSGKSQGILTRLEKSGKSQGKSHKILENSGNFRQILFVIFY